MSQRDKERERERGKKMGKDPEVERTSKGKRSHIWERRRGTRIRVVFISQE